MKKVKLQLRFAEAEALYAELFNNAVSLRSKDYDVRIVAALLTELYMKLAPKVMFKSDKKLKLTISAATACALVLYYTWSPRSDENYMDNLLHRMVMSIDQQLA